MKNREGHIDVLRIISAFAVVIIHTISSHISAVEIVPDNVKNIGSVVCILMRWAVPVFFMITGYCLLKKEECTFKYCFKQIRKFAIILATFGFFYALLEQCFLHGFKFKIIWLSILNVINGDLWDHMWYVYAIIGVYLIMPVIHFFIKKDKKNAYILTSILFVFTILIPTINSFGFFSIDFMFPLGGYLFYVCFGGIVSRFDIKKWIKIVTFIAGGISILLIIFVNNIAYGYLSLPICMIAMSIFLLLNTKKYKSNRVINLFATTTFGIYIIHPFFMNLFNKALNFDAVSNLAIIKLPILCVVYFLISFGTVYLMKKIPLVKKIL